MAKRSSSKKRPPYKPWLPDPKDVVEVKDVRSPEVGTFKIVRTNIVDPYDEPLPPPKSPRSRKKCDGY